jgi:hypothetical protein
VPDLENQPGCAPLDLPREDRDRSPQTGWTRAHWERLADILLDGVRPYETAGRALINLPGPRPSSRGSYSDGLEGFARTFMLAAYRLRGSGGDAPGDLVDRYSQGLAAGSDPRSPDAWPRHEDGSQSLVEAALIAAALFESRPWIWDKLPDDLRERVVAWLSGVQGKRHWHSNWLLFPVVVNAFLKSVGAPYRADEIERNLDLVDGMYRGGGWYSDGVGRSFDHYAAWSFHFYLPLWCRIDGERSDPARAALLIERLRLFLDDYRHLFAANGAPLHHGRSLVYRFACVAPFWAGALAEATPLSPGETRRIASGAARYFLERGALRSGVLTMGWHSECLPSVQSYSGPGSAYWVSKAFLGLVLAEDHPVWTAREEPNPVERGDFRRAIEEPGFLVSGTRADGVIRVSTHASDHFPFTSKPLDDAHYRKLAYSTHTAPSTGPGDELDLDSQFTLTGGDAPASRRRSFAPLGVTDSSASSVSDSFDAGRAVGARHALALERRLPEWLEHRIPLVRSPWWRPALALARSRPVRALGVRLERIESVSVPRGRTEVRIQRVWTPFPRQARAGGFALADAKLPEVESGGSWALARREDGLTSFVMGLVGFDRADVMRLEDANALGRHAVVPFLVAEQRIEREGTFVWLVILTAEPLDPAEAGAEVVAEPSQDDVTLTFRDGEKVVVPPGNRG